jgi:hypothetical protein
MIEMSEIWFKTQHTHRLVGRDGFRVIRADRERGRRGGGLALYLRENLRYKVVARSKSTSVVDYLIIELRLPYPVVVCAIYNHPNINGFSIFRVTRSSMSSTSSSNSYHHHSYKDSCPIVTLWRHTCQSIEVLS